MIRWLAPLLLAATVHADIIGFAVKPPTTTPTFAIESASSTVNPQNAAAIWPDVDTTADSLLCGSTVAPGGGNSWTITVQTANAGTNIFFDAGFSCVISGTATHCLAPLHATTWHQDGSLSFLITPAGTPTVGGSDKLQCALRLSGTRRIGTSGVLLPSVGTNTAFGSVEFGTTDDNSAFSVLLGTFGSNISRLTCIVDTPPGMTAGWNIRVRYWDFGWVNSPLNCTINDTATTCQDLVNTQAVNGNGNRVTYRLTVSKGTPVATAHLRCANIYFFM